MGELMKFFYATIGLIAKYNFDFRNYSFNSIRVSWAVSSFFFFLVVISYQQYNYFIVFENSKTGNLIAWGTVLILSIAILLLLFLTAILNYTIFQSLKKIKTNHIISLLNKLEHILATGTLYTYSYKKYFIGLPAIFEKGEKDEFTFTSIINADSNYDYNHHGIRIMEEDLDGIWKTHFKPEDIIKSEAGYLYFGTHPIPSIRLKYRDSYKSGKGSNLVISFESEKELSKIIKI